jgi:hypothetical protein
MQPIGSTKFTAIVPGHVFGTYSLFTIKGKFGTCEEALFFLQMRDNLGEITPDGTLTATDLARLEANPVSASTGRTLRKMGAVCWITDAPQIRYYCHRRALGFMRRVVRALHENDIEFEEPR